MVALRQAQVFWFVHRGGQFVPLAPGADGVLRSETFPGLWLDPEAFLRGDEERLLAVLRKASPPPNMPPSCNV